MQIDATDQARLSRAVRLALAWHATQSRKGTEVPYVSHLLQVAGLVLEHGGDVDQAVAGLLHDALEDAHSTEERSGREATLRDEFGDDVLRMVHACTDTEADETLGNKAPWRPRKRRFLERLARADSRSALVAACDKHHNLGALVGDVRAQGIGCLERFRAGAADQLWYYERAVEVLRDRVPRRLAQELDALVADFRALAG